MQSWKSQPLEHKNLELIPRLLFTVYEVLAKWHINLHIPIKLPIY